MKISIVAQYYNRRSQFLNTLNSIKHTKIPFNEFEVIIVDDASSEEHQINDVDQLFPELDIKLYSFKEEDKWWSCPVLPINKGLSMASGDIIILLCAECMFVGDILLDVKNRIKKNDYLVYSTLGLSKETSEAIQYMPYDYIIGNHKKEDWVLHQNSSWYQHSIYNNNCYNFCNAILKEDLDKLGGFDERFAFGYDSGDVNFIWRVRELGMNVISIDDPLTYHQWHPPYLFDEFSKRESVSNFSGISIQKYIEKNESNLKVNNSFVNNVDYIPLCPELKQINKKMNLHFNINRIEGTFVEFKCDYSNIFVDVKITDSNGDFINFKLRNNTWILYKQFNKSETCEFEISIDGKVIYSPDISLGEHVIINIEKIVKILSHI